MVGQFGPNVGGEFGPESRGVSLDPNLGAPKQEDSSLRSFRLCVRSGRPRPVASQLTPNIYIITFLAFFASLRKIRPDQTSQSKLLFSSCLLSVLCGFA
jgi:hypothetical protein